MNSTVMVKKGYVIAQPREQQLNEAILKAGVTADVERCLKVFDEFYDDEVVIAESALAVPARGKAENRERLESFLIFARVIIEVGEYRLNRLRLMDSRVESGFNVTDWELEFSGPEGDWKQMRRRVARLWDGGKVAYERHCRLPTSRAGA